MGSSCFKETVTSTSVRKWATTLRAMYTPARRRPDLGLKSYHAIIPAAR